MLFECVSYRWSPGIGDPSLAGWLTVLAYVAAAGLALLRARDAFAPGMAAAPGGGALRAFWLGLAALLLFMALNKQLDLQSAATAAGRCLALEQGWYQSRRGAQIAFMAALAGAGLAAAGAVLWMMRRHLRSHRLVISGAGLLLVFVMLRASSFHHMDVFINTRLLGVKMNWLFELGALAMIIAGARRPLQTPAPPLSTQDPS